MDTKEIEDRYGNYNKLIVDKIGRLVYIMWQHNQATDYEVTGLTETCSFTLRKMNKT